MPAKSESQKRLFCMAYAVRKGKLARNKVSKAVLDIADGDMTDKEIKEFMVKECETLMDYLNEALYETPYAMKEEGYTFPEERRIFVIIKPGFINLSEEIVKEFEKHHYKLHSTKTKKLLESEARELYAIHKDESFYEDLVKYMSSDLSIGMLFTPTRKKKIDQVFKETGKIKDLLREKYGESDMRNVIHSSDSIEHMHDEEQIYFYTNQYERK